MKPVNVNRTTTIMYMVYSYNGRNLKYVCTTDWEAKGFNFKLSNDKNTMQYKLYFLLNLKLRKFALRLQDTTVSACKIIYLNRKMYNTENRKLQFLLCSRKLISIPKWQMHLLTFKQDKMEEVLRNSDSCVWMLQAVQQGFQLNI